MGCRSLVGVECADGRVRYIYIHHNGYIENLGQHLKTHYRTFGDVQALIQQGSRSFLGLDRQEGLYHEKFRVEESVEDFGARAKSSWAIEYVYLFRPEDEATAFFFSGVESESEGEDSDDEPKPEPESKSEPEPKPDCSALPGKWLVLPNKIEFVEFV